MELEKKTDNFIDLNHDIPEAKSLAPVSGQEPNQLDQRPNMELETSIRQVNSNQLEEIMLDPVTHFSDTQERSFENPPELGIQINGLKSMDSHNSGQGLESAMEYWEDFRSKDTNYIWDYENLGKITFSSHFFWGNSGRK